MQETAPTCNQIIYTQEGTCAVCVKFYTVASESVMITKY